jgi:RNA 3'-terminal phosphate cyclase (ATP)
MNWKAPSPNPLCRGDLMIDIDGSKHSGSGTLLRYAVALATLTGESLHMTRIRAKRPKPGLRAQHLQAVKACAALSRGRVEGAEVGSREIFYWPGDRIHSGSFHFDIGTAGSACMATFSLIPGALFATGPCKFTVVGGLFQDFAPPFFHVQRVLLPVLRHMVADVKLEMVRPGYVPEGKGELILTVNPLSGSLNPLHLVEQGSVRSIRGISLASHLSEQKVAGRMAERCGDSLKRRGFVTEIDIMEDSTAAQRGAALTVWASTSTGCVIGADQAGKIGRKSESIADFVAKSLLDDLKSGATVDRHLADQLIIFAALAKGRSEYRIPCVTDHVLSNLWLVEIMLGVRTQLQGHVLTVEGVGFRPR